MLKGLEYVKETIEFRKGDIENNEFETNNLLLDDILISLGYNKRRESGIKSVYSGDADWEISCGGEPRFVIAVYGYNSEKPSLEQLDRVFDFAYNGDYPYIILTNGESLSIFKDRQELADIPSIFEDTADEILGYISRNGWNPEALDKLGKKEIPVEKVLELLNSSDIHKKLLSELEIEVTPEALEEIAAKVQDITTNKVEVDTDTSTDEPSANNEDIASNQSLSEEIQSLKGQLDQANEKVAQLEKDNTELNTKLSEVSSLESDKTALDTQISQLTSELDKSNTILHQIESEKNELNTELAKVREEKNWLGTELSNANERIKKLESELENASNDPNTDDTLVNQLNSEIAELKLEIEQLNNEKSTAETKLSSELENSETLRNELDKVHSELDALKNKANEVVADVASLEESDYRNKIAELIEKNQKLEVELQSTKEELDELKRKQEGAEDEKVVMARQLLEAVEDNVELQRTYVGVVDTKLFQINDLPRFVGTCLQELYSVVSFDLMHLLFDGDIFKVIQPAVRGDLMINTKTYDINVDGLTENEVISKLKMLFSKFPHVVFMCKAIGTYRAPEVPNEYQDLDSLELDTNVDTSIGSKGAEIEVNVSPEDDDTEIDFGAPVNKSTPSEIIPQDNIQYIALALCDVTSVLWLENSPIINLEAIGDEYRVLKVNSDQLRFTFNTGLLSLLSMADSALNAVDTLRTTDLTSISALISQGSVGDNSIQILDTNYYVNIDSEQQCISLLIQISEHLGIDGTRVYMYFNAEYDESSEFIDNFVSRESIDTTARINYEELEPCADRLHCILSGSGIEKIQSVPGVFNIEKEVINNIVAIRNRYMTSALRSNKDIAKTIMEMFKDVEESDIEFIIDYVNTSVPSFSSVILSEEDEHSDKAQEMTIGNKTYYLEELPGYIATLMMYYLHCRITGENVVDIRIELDSTKYMAYKNGVNTSDCMEYLASRLFVEITEGKTKVIVK